MSTASADQVTYHCTLTPELLQKAQDELKEKPEWRARDIQALRDMVLNHKGLNARTDDAFLLRFLRAKKFDYDRAYNLQINYYTIRAENDEFFKDLKPSTIKHVLDAGVSYVMPHRDKLGRKILLFRPGKWDPSQYSIYDILRTNLMNLEVMIEDEETQVNGIIAIGDMTDMSWTQFKSFERNYARLMTSLMQIHCVLKAEMGSADYLALDIFRSRSSGFRNWWMLMAKISSSGYNEAFPARFKGMHAINEPALLGYIFGIIRPFLKEKMAQRLNFHGSDLDSLQKQFEPEILPQELGGTLGPADVLAAQWKETLLGRESYFEDMMQYHIEVPHQIASTSTKDDMDCLTGTYKKLNVD